MWKDYIEYFEKKHNMKIKYLNFRDKRNGWSKPYVYASDGKKEISTLDYVELFYSKAALNEKCYSCKYASLDRPGDITIGDFWGIERVMPDFYDEKGVSLVITNTEKGEKLFELAKASIVYRESNVNDCLQPNLCRPTEKSADRDKFLLDYKKHGIGYVIGKYTRTSFRGKLRFKIKYLLNGKRG